MWHALVAREAGDLLADLGYQPQAHQQRWLAFIAGSTRIRERAHRVASRGRRLARAARKGSS